MKSTSLCQIGSIPSLIPGRLIIGSKRTIHHSSPHSEVLHGIVLTLHSYSGYPRPRPLTHWHPLTPLRVLQAEKHWLLLTFLITIGVLSLFALVYCCIRSLSACLSYRRFRTNAWTRLRKSNANHDEGIWSSSSLSDRDSSDQNWIEMETTEKGGQSPHFE